MAVGDDHIGRNRARQAEWYGEPLSERLGRLLRHLGISQAMLADILGLSAPMLSQLMSGQRAKISNPAVFARLISLEEIAVDPRRIHWSPAEAQARLGAVRAQQPTTSSVLRATTGAAAASAVEPVAGVGAVAGAASAAGVGAVAGVAAAADAAAAAAVRQEPGVRAADPVAAIQSLLRAVASASEIDAAARLLDAAYPDLATLLRVYGNGRTADARAHFAAVTGDPV